MKKIFVVILVCSIFLSYPAIAANKLGIIVCTVEAINKNCPEAIDAKNKSINFKTLIKKAFAGQDNVLNFNPKNSQAFIINGKEKTKFQDAMGELKNYVKKIRSSGREEWLDGADVTIYSDTKSRVNGKANDQEASFYYFKLISK